MIDDRKRILYGVSLLVFPPMLLAGFLMHPDLLSFEVVHDANGLITNFRGSAMYHIGHLIVFWSVPFIVFALMGMITLSGSNGRSLRTLGGVVGLVGAVILAGDKGALCIVLSAFDTLNDVEFAAITPALEAIAARKGLLAIFYLLPLLPLGAALQLVGMIKDGYVKAGSGIAAIVGLLLLNNPDIELISSVGALLMCVGYVPIGIGFLKEGTK
jgi:hypothetical protein